MGSQFTITESKLKGAYIIKPFMTLDQRGYLLKDYSQEAFTQLGLDYDIKETFYTFNFQGSLRGVHFQMGQPMPKLMRCVKGSVYYVLVDLRPESPTFGQWEHYTLNDFDHNMSVLCPAGFGQGYLALEQSIMSYKAAAPFYGPGDAGIKYNDPDLKIDWPTFLVGDKITISEKDKNLMSFQEYKKLINERTISL